MSSFFFLIIAKVIIALLHYFYVKVGPSWL